MIYFNILFETTEGLVLIAWLVCSNLMVSSQLLILLWGTTQKSNLYKLHSSATKTTVLFFRQKENLKFLSNDWEGVKLAIQEEPYLLKSTMGQEWLVLAASVVINCLIKGSLKSLGVVLEELNRHGIDPSQSAWIPAIAYTLFACLSTPVARLPAIFPPRYVVVLGGIMASMGQCLTHIIIQVYLPRFPSGCKQFFPSPPLPWPWRRSGHWRLPGFDHGGAWDQQKVHGDKTRHGTWLEPCRKYTGRTSPPWQHGAPLRELGKIWRPCNPLGNPLKHSACSSFLLWPSGESGRQGGGKSRGRRGKGFVIPLVLYFLIIIVTTTFIILILIKGLVKPTLLVLHLFHGFDHNRLHKLWSLPSLAPHWHPW